MFIIWSGLVVTTADQITEYLHRHIPLSGAMGVQAILAGDDLVRLKAPLQPNINHQNTLFGGSGSTVLTLAAWTLLHVRLSSLPGRFDLVIAEGTTTYSKPVRGDFEAVSDSEGIEWSKFLRSISRKGKGKIEVSSRLIFEGEVCASFRGVFVAVRSEPK